MFIIMTVYFEDEYKQAVLIVVRNDVGMSGV